jgi:O-antigen/teichoic acid export membrane protein
MNPIKTAKEVLTAVQIKTKDNPIVYRLTKGSFWILVGTISAKLFSMVSTIIIARMLGKSHYGELTMIMSTVSMFGIFSGFSLGSTGNKYIAEYRTKNPERAGRIIGLTTMLALLLSSATAVFVFISAPYLSREHLNSPGLASLVRLSALLLFMTTLRNYRIGPLAGFESFKKIGQINFIEGAITPFVSVPLVYYLGLPGAILGLVFSTSVAFSLCGLAIKKECARNHVPLTIFKADNWKEWRILPKFTLPAIISGLFVPPVLWFCNTVLVKQPNGYAELGLFQAANQWRMLIAFIPSLLAGVMMPIFSETFSKESNKDFVYAFEINMKVTWSFALPMTIIVISLNKPLGALFGKQFSGMEYIIIFLMISVFFSTINEVIGTGIAGAGRMWVGLLTNIAWATVITISTSVLVPKLSARGLALSYLIAYFLHTIWQLAYVELFLAPKLVSKLLTLMGYSFLLLLATFLFKYFGGASIIVGFLLASLSCIPVLYFFYAKFRKIVAGA